MASDEDIAEPVTVLDAPRADGKVPTHEIPFGMERVSAEIMDFFRGYTMTYVRYCLLCFILLPWRALMFLLLLSVRVIGVV
jgi:hypothetical protein